MRQTLEVFTCETCGKEHFSEAEYDKCVLSHDIVFVGLERAEWREVFSTLSHAMANGIVLREAVARKLFKYKMRVTN